MQRMALIGDIHGNLPALEAVLADIDRREIQSIVCLGDLAGKGPSGARVVDICQERCDVTILGNWDAALAAREGKAAFQWHRRELGEARLAWLGALPFAYDFLLSGQRVRLVHASPQGVNHRVYQAGSIAPMRAMFEPTELTDDTFAPDVVGYADIHTPFVRTFRDQTLFNVGSVGNPLDTTLACYVVLEGPLGDVSLVPWGLQTVRVPYDIERAVAEARAAGSPHANAWEFELTTARHRGKMARQAW